MAKNREFPTTIVLRSGKRVAAPADFDPRRPDLKTIERLEKEHGPKGDPAESD